MLRSLTFAVPVPEQRPGSSPCGVDWVNRGQGILLPAAPPPAKTPVPAHDLHASHSERVRVGTHLARGSIQVRKAGLPAPVYRERAEATAMAGGAPTVSGVTEHQDFFKGFFKGQGPGPIFLNQTPPTLEDSGPPENLPDQPISQPRGLGSLQSPCLFLAPYVQGLTEAGGWGTSRHAKLLSLL